MSSSRIFVTNLAPRTTEQDLERLFQDYGKVLQVELKTKENLVDESQNKIIAFVTIKTDDVEYCINDVSYQKLHGAKLKVSLAKESFLERLKREREEANQAQDKNENLHEIARQTADYLPQSNQNKRRIFAEDEELNDDDISPELLISKKCAASSMRNGKIVIQKDYDATPLHIIENKKIVKKLDSNTSVAEQKRKESLNKMKNQYEQQKTAIQQALAGVEGNAAKKIKFSDAEEEDDVADAAPTKKQKQKQKKNLFDEDDAVDEHVLLPQYKGKKGEKLYQMQSKQSLDPRFKISDKFVDDDNDDEYDEHDDDNVDEAEADVQENERNWQLGILEQVVGHKINTATDANGENNAKNKRMLRFDPSKEDHQKLLRQKQQQQKETENKSKTKQQNKQNKESTDNVASDGTNTAPVSKEVFYVVADTLQNSLKMRGDGFSLLNMFGNAEYNEQKRDEELQKISNEKIIVNKLDKMKTGTLNPFSYDSSSTSDDEETEPTTKPETAPSNQQQQQQKNLKKTGTKSKVNLFVETFFIPKNDIRLKEGANFFKYDKTKVNVEDYEEVRNRLKLLIKTKITKTKKKLAASGVKMRKGKTFKKQTLKKKD